MSVPVNGMKRSISMPVKPRYLDEDNSLERSEEKEELFSNHNVDQIDEIEEQEIESVQESQVIEQDDLQLECHHSSIAHSGRESCNDHQHEEHHESHQELERSRSRPDNSNGSKANIGIQSPCIYQRPSGFNFPSSHRVISSRGSQNICFKSIPKRRWQYLKDVVTTLIECKWRYTMLVFLSGYFVVWLFCTVIWYYLIAAAHGDLTFNETTGERMNDGEKTCVKGGDTFTGMFIYVVETHTSIGFGERIPTDECPEGVFFYAAQLVLYIGVEGMLISIVYSKIARPIRRMAGPKFSKRAVVCLRDGMHCLIFRVCDQDEQQTIGTKISAYFLQNKSTKEGEFIHKSPVQLKLENNGEASILWPTTICHVIDRKSPFYKYTADDFVNKDFEIVVSCTGTSPSTGQFTECITSYVPNEIYWGERFANIIHFNWKRGSYVVDYNNFDKTVSVKMPMYSAHQLRQMLKAVQNRAPAIE